MEGIFLLICIGIVILWIFAGVRMNVHGGSAGTKQYFAWLLGTLLFCGLLFVVIVVPSLDCSGFLCGLGEILIFMLATAIILFVAPVLLLTVGVSRLKKKSPSKRMEDELII